MGPFSWGQYPVVTANVDPGPNGGASTADEVTLTSANSGLYYQTNVAGTYTFSVWVRLISGDGNFALNYYSGSTESPDAGRACHRHVAAGQPDLHRRRQHLFQRRDHA